MKKCFANTGVRGHVQNAPNTHKPSIIGRSVE